MQPFKKEYAELYDSMYTEKDYQREVDLIGRVINEYKPDTKRMLDYGCGTGNHTKALASGDYEIYGIDRNEHMLAVAREKLKDRKNVHLFAADERSDVPENSVDVCLLLFDVLSYMNTNDEIDDFMGYVKTVLKKGGLLIFDFWYGPGVISMGPEKRRKVYASGGKEVVRLTRPEHDRHRCIVTVACDITVSENDSVIDRFSDLHRMRYFFINEIELFMKHHGFEVLKLGTWEDIDAPPTTGDWSALAVCRRAL